MIRIVKEMYQELFDGTENDCREQTFTVNGREIRLLDIINNPLRELKNKICADDFNAIVQTGRLKLNMLICDSYTTPKGLHVYFLLDSNSLYIFSYEELQPARVTLYIESLWKIESS